MRVLFVHQNAPAQYQHLARDLAADPANEVVFITRPGRPAVPGARMIEYQPSRTAAKTTHHYLTGTENAVLAGQAVLRVAALLHRSGFRPDIVCAHPGWGEALYLKDLWPDTPILAYCEFYYHARGVDLDFDPAAPPDQDSICRVRTRNAVGLLSLDACDAGISPTQWQADLFPREFRSKIRIIHDGVDTERCRPDPMATLVLPDGRTLSAADEVVTYVTRNFEPYRGFPTVMRAIGLLQRRRPDAHFVLIGGDGVSYSRRPPEGQSYREMMRQEVPVDPDRVHFLGQVPYDIFLRTLQISRAHLYLTVPFVLSWSVLEAMAAGCLVVASRTAPVAEIIEDGVNGLLADFFSPEEVADRVEQALEAPDRLAALRQAARRTIIERYDLPSCLAAQKRLLAELAATSSRTESASYTPPAGADAAMRSR